MRGKKPFDRGSPTRDHLPFQRTCSSANVLLGSLCNVTGLQQQGGLMLPRVDDDDIHDKNQFRGKGNLFSADGGRLARTATAGFFLFLKRDKTGSDINHARSLKFGPRERSCFETPFVSFSPLFIFFC